jgi:glycosyltransferase involved in cell wall biosynthesis
MKMTISVIIPTLNEERTIMATLAHTAALGFNELIVVDGGSLDQTPVLVESYRRKTQPRAQSPIQLVITPCGRARQMNEGGPVTEKSFSFSSRHVPDDANDD